MLAVKEYSFVVKIERIYIPTYVYYVIVSDKAENMWDFYTHNHPELIPDQSNGDIAANSYYKYQEDVAWIKSLGVSRRVIKCR